MAFDVNFSRQGDSCRLVKQLTSIFMMETTNDVEIYHAKRPPHADVCVLFAAFFSNKECKEFHCHTHIDRELRLIQRIFLRLLLALIYIVLNEKFNSQCSQQASRREIFLLRPSSSFFVTVNKPSQIAYDMDECMDEQRDVSEQPQFLLFFFVSVVVGLKSDNPHDDQTNYAIVSN